LNECDDLVASIKPKERDADLGGARLDPHPHDAKGERAIGLEAAVVDNLR